MIKELRGHYGTVRADPKTWQVSSGPDAKKHTASTEPHIEGLGALWKTAGLDRDDADFAERVRNRFGT